MANDIKIGDLVMVTKPMQCCGGTVILGKIFTVKNIVKARITCGNCSAINYSLYADGVGFIGTTLSSLIKIDQPALPEEITKDEIIKIDDEEYKVPAEMLMSFMNQKNYIKKLNNIKKKYRKG